MPALEALDLAYCNGFVDNAVYDLEPCKKLRTLVLTSCRAVTDVGLYILAGMPSLVDLYLDGCCGITEAGMKMTRQARAQLNMIRISAS